MNELWEFITEARANGITNHAEIVKARDAKAKAEYQQSTQAATRNTAPRTGEPWGAADMTVLSMPHLTVKEQARALGRTYYAVKAARIKLRKPGSA